MNASNPRAQRYNDVMRWLKRLLLLFGGLSLVASIALGAYLYHLDGVITEIFDGRRWALPATVFGQPTELYAGARLSRDELTAELTALGYRQRAHVRSPGAFQQRGNALVIHLRPFRFMERERRETIVEVAFAGGAISELHEQPGNRRMDLVRLDPPQIGSFYPNQGEDRLVLGPHEVPRLLREGLKAVEDQNFDKHPGFDIRGIARAFWVNISSGELRQGGSTLTQQLVKSYFLSNERKLSRKLRELAMAVILDARYSKADLINAYINEIYLAQDGARAVHGFGLGAHYYFNQPLAELAPHQIALLIGVIRGPSYYNPRRNPKRALERRDLVLTLMHRQQLINDDELALAIEQPLAVSSGTGGSVYQPAFMDLVRNQLRDNYSSESLTDEGLRVFTTLSARLQRAAGEAIEESLTEIETSRGLEAGSLQASMVIANAQTGDLLAVVGGRNSSYNRALNAKRQIGSLFKPVVYLAALESGRYNLASVLRDEAISVPAGRNQPDWQPKNFDGEIYGNVPLFQALAKSLNLATVSLGMDVGVERIGQRYGELIGGEAPPAFPSLLLGALDLSPLQVARLYGNFASGGFDAIPNPVIAVLDANNLTIDGFPIALRQTIAPNVSEQLTAALMTTMSHGTGRRSPFAKSGIAGKTGTSDGNRDSWFAGFDGRHLVVIWVGRDDNDRTPLTGSTGALAVFNKLAEKIGVEPLPPIRGEKLDPQTGLRSREACGEVITLPLPDNLDLPYVDGCGDSIRDSIRAWWSR
ncbi:MAG: transglycosylase domain-containing protein [Pseudomonadaceae bacterium]|nr:transglycosylase domain-containing protein [Pseudomonadaceae bacterium]